MNKKVILGAIIGVLILAVAVAIALMIKNSDQIHTDVLDSGDIENDSIKGENKMSGKTLVVYYSAQGHTKRIADEIAQQLGADTFELISKENYSAEDLDWTDDGSRVNREHDDESLRDIALENTEVPNWGEYETVLIGYPIWWGIATWPVNAFVKENDFSGKTVIPFCTSSSSGLGESGELLEAMAGAGDWRDGKRFSSSALSSEIEDWVNKLK